MTHCSFTRNGTVWECPACGSKWPIRGERPPKRECRKPTLVEKCKHLGDAVGTTVDCAGCTGTVKLKLYACAIHGECTLGKKLDGIACCAQCPDYAPSRRDAEVDDGRNG